MLVLGAWPGGCGSHAGSCAQKRSQPRRAGLLAAPLPTAGGRPPQDHHAPNLQDRARRRQGVRRQPGGRWGAWQRCSRVLAFCMCSPRARRTSTTRLCLPLPLPPAPAGANIAGFLKVGEAVLAQGAV